jgi:hypothetical protein
MLGANVRNSTDAGEAVSEELYDREIAPKLKEISEACQRAGMPFVALCEYEPGKEGRTEFMPLSASMAMNITAFAARCGNNVDALFIGIARFCAKHEIDTSASMVMRRMAATDDTAKHG